MYKFLIVALVASMACGSLAYGVSNPADALAHTLKSNSDIDPLGNYAYDYSTSNGISAQEKGVGGQYAAGAYTYYSPEGELVQTSYVADANGFQATGSHIPQIPPAILKSLEYIRTHPRYIGHL